MFIAAEVNLFLIHAINMYHSNPKIMYLHILVVDKQYANMNFKLCEHDKLYFKILLF